MPDREKVIKGLEGTEIMLKQAVDHGGEMSVMGAFKCYNHVSDAIALLKEQKGLMLALEQSNAVNEYLNAEVERLNGLLKEQEAVKWINVKDRLPEKDGLYLVVYTFFDCRGMGVVRFSHNLHEIDEYIFDTESRPGWYEPDDEVGYFERTTVTHWAKLPEFPKEGR